MAQLLSEATSASADGPALRTTTVDACDRVRALDLAERDALRVELLQDGGQAARKRALARAARAPDVWW